VSSTASSGWGRRLLLPLALLVTLLAAVLPASAAPSTKNYSQTLTTTGAPGASVLAVPGSLVTLTLRNELSSSQTFGSARVTVTNVVTDPADPAMAKASVSLATGWSVGAATVSGATVSWLLTSTGTTSAIVPGGSLSVVLQLSPAVAGSPTSVTTQVRQSNDFRGTNNDFALTTTDPLSVTWSLSCADPTCLTSFAPSPINGVTADLTLTSAAPFTYVAGFTTARLSCNDIPFGGKVPAEPFQVKTDHTASVAKRLVLTFPKALANLVPNNGTPLFPVCAGGEARFPGSTAQPAGAAYLFEGLLLNCDDPAYVAATTGTDPAPLQMCVQSRARNAGNLIVTITVAAGTVDPMYW
jgi:hypothetical protein